MRHPHAFLARLRNILRDDLPDVRQALLDAGSLEVSWSDFARETLDDPTPLPDDGDMTLIACRRTTFEWVLRKAALHTERVQLRDGVQVTGLMSAPGSAPPRVTGVSLRDGDIDADLVIDAGGRHSQMQALLGAIGVNVPETKHDCGMVYLSRFYRLRDGATEPDQQAFNGGTLGYLGYGIFRGDNRTFSVTLAIGTEDKELRALIGMQRFDEAAGDLLTPAWTRSPARREAAQFAQQFPGLEPAATEMVRQHRAQRAAQAGQVVAVGDGHAGHVVVRGQRQQRAAGRRIAAVAVAAIAQQPPRPVLRVDAVARGRIDRHAIAIDRAVEAEAQRLEQVALEAPQGPAQRLARAQPRAGARIGGEQLGLRVAARRQAQHQFVDVERG